ncbi:hypothetical protein EG240_09980 [Paenimyroides tangerinum]|uniref:Uncharacterized protein n=1 Tax=Paenimyroides tangerinum TaxID=2488728 RepID=A0A3P3W8Y1_9FLAO|nr:hypothetical protein [Paenimyroides tangerinum]RRJ90069.1 hypothetical protein EG240_09980 [Paenimyroides tangerinum]
MISSKELNIPNQNKLQTICKAISVLDAILSQEWPFRYYSYNKNWSDSEEFFEMRNGSGDQMLILFNQNGCVINGFAHEYPYREKEKLTKNVPVIFDEFIYGEPVNSIGTTFCIWISKDDDKWKIGQVEDFDDNSQEMLAVFDGEPQTYIDWATEYFDECFIETGIPLETVNDIYNGKTLTKKMVLTIVDELEDWEQLENDLNEIGYPYHFS